MNSLQATVAYGQPAVELLHDQRFISSWQSLCDHCAHSTTFQSPNFLCAWYDDYGNLWQPVIVQSKDPHGNLVGLWLLAYEKKTNTLVHAGTHQAEYHAWLALPSHDVEFLSAAWDALTRQLQFTELVFKYLPTGALVDTLQTAFSSKNVVARKQQRPLLNLNADEVKESFAKKSNKSRFNRLKKLGKLEFRPITNSVELQRVMDDLIDCYDFRQGAINHVLPFREDGQKKKFHIDLFANSASSEICVTATFLDEQPIAAFWGSITGKTVHLGMLIHSPLYAEHSPGKLHIMQLSQYLLEQGKSALDLTPGGDAWKERFANAHDEVADAVVYRSAQKKLFVDLREAFLTRGKQIAARIGITPARLRATANKFRQAHPAAAARTLRGWLASTEEFRVYRGDSARVKSCSMDARVKRNSLNDLMSFEPDDTKTRETFLSEALMRLERGESAYTLCIDNRLAQCSWMVDGGTEVPLPQVQQMLRCPPGSVALYDLYLHPQFRNQHLNEAVLRHMLYVVFSNANVQYLYVPVPATDTSRRLLESLEFEYLGSFNWKRRVGIVHKSATSQILAQLESNTESA